MAKKHRRRPALRAVRLWQDVIRGTLDAGPIRRSPLWAVRKGTHIYQHWLRKTKSGRIVKEKARTYIGLVILAPWWRSVPDWEIEYLNSKNVDLRGQGIIKFKDGYRRLCYDQVKRLDAAYRQGKYVVEGYFDLKNITDFDSMLDEMVRARNIVEKVEDRNARLESEILSIARELHHFQGRIKNYLENSPAFTKNDKAEQQRDARIFEQIAEKLRGPEYRIRPISGKMILAARQLETAADFLRSSDTIVARHFSELAIKKIEYQPKLVREKLEAPSEQSNTPPDANN